MHYAKTKEGKKMQKNTNVQQLLADLHGGILEKKLAHVLSQAAIAAINPNGIVFDLPNEIYHAGPELSASGLKLLQKTPAHYKAAKQEKNEPSKAMIFGTAVHCAILEPEQLQNRFVMIPDGVDGRTKDGKQIMADIAASGKTGIKSDDWQAIEIIKKQALNNPFIKKLFSKNHAVEASLYFERNGVKCRIRPDLMVSPCDEFENGVICDVKTAQDAGPEGFARAAWDYGYHLQNEFYSNGYQQIFGTKKPPVFMFYVVENTAPFLDAVYIMPDDLIDYSKAKNDELIATFKRCSDSNIWPGYDKRATVLSVPGWVQSVINKQKEG